MHPMIFGIVRQIQTLGPALQYYPAVLFCSPRWQSHQANPSGCTTDQAERAQSTSAHRLLNI